MGRLRKRKNFFSRPPTEECLPVSSLLEPGLFVTDHNDRFLPIANGLSLQTIDVFLENYFIITNLKYRYPIKNSTCHLSYFQFRTGYFFLFSDEEFFIQLIMDFVNKKPSIFHFVVRMILF